MPKITSPAVVNRDDVLLAAQGLKGENFNRYAVASGTIGISGTAYYQGTPFVAGDVVTNIHVRVLTIGAAITACKVGLYSLAGTQLAASADLGTSWQSGGIKTHALSAPYSVLATGMLYVTLFHVAGTAATLIRAGVQTGVFEAVTGSMLFGAQTGLADLPSPTATIANSNQIGYWVGWS